MSNKNFKQIQQLSKDEVVTKVRETESHLFKARMQRATGQLKDTALLWRERKALARLKTRLTQMNG